MHIRQSLLDDSEESRLNLPSKAFRGFIELECQLHLAPFRESLGLPLYGKEKATFIQKWRMQQVGHGSKFTYGFLQEIFHLAQTGLAAGRQGFWTRTCLRDCHKCTGQRLTHSIVKIAGDTPAFLILNGEDLC